MGNPAQAETARHEVDDLRRGGWWWVGNAIIDDDLVKIGPLAFTIYCVLVRRANTRLRCWPSIASLIQSSGMSRSSVLRALDILETHALIRREKRPGGVTRYVLIDKGQYPTETEKQGGSVTQTLHQSHTDTAPVSHRHPEEDSSEQDSLNKKERGAPRARRAPIPDDFSLTEERKRFAIVGGLTDVNLVWGHFVDYHRAHGSVMKDWNAAWQTWCRKERAMREGKSRWKR